MYPNPLINNTLSLSKILGGISKTISVANQVIPIYKQAKPLISNFSSTANLIRSITKDSTSSKKEIKEAEIKEVVQSSSNSPTFFQ